MIYLAIVNYCLFGNVIIEKIYVLLNTFLTSVGVKSTSAKENEYNVLDEWNKYFATFQSSRSSRSRAYT